MCVCVAFHVLYGCMRGACCLLQRQCVLLSVLDSLLRQPVCVCAGVCVCVCVGGVVHMYVSLVGLCRCVGVWLSVCVYVCLCVSSCLCPTEWVCICMHC